MKAGGETGEAKTRVDAFYKKIEFHKGDQRKTKAKPVVHWAQNPKWSKQFLKRSDIDTTESTYPFFENFIEESKTIAKSPIEEVTKREQEWYPSSSEFLAPKLEVAVARQPSPPAGDFDNDEEAVDVDQVFVTHRFCRSLPKNINRIKALSL